MVYIILERKMRLDNRISTPDSSTANIEYQYKEAVKQFTDNSVELDGEKYVNLDKALELLKNVSTFSSLFS